MSGARCRRARRSPAFSLRRRQTSGNVGIDDPVLQVRAAIVVERPELALVDQLLGQHHRRRAPVVVADHVDDAGLLHRGQHLLGFLDGVGQRLLAEHDLAGLGRFDRDLRVAVARRARCRRCRCPCGGRPRASRWRSLPSPSCAAAVFTASGVRPQRTFIRGGCFGVKKRLTWRYALLCARPMKA